MSHAAAHRGIRVLTRVVLPAALGMLAYAAWRPPTTWIARQLGPIPLPDAMRFFLDAVPPWLRGPWPDACWAWAVCAAAALAWSDAADTPPARAWCAAAWCLVPGAELGQWAGLLPGTFDVLDLVASALAGAWALRVASARTPNRREHPAS